MDIKNFIRTLSTMHIFLVAGLFLFSVFAYLQVSDFNTNTEGLGLFLFIVPVLALMGYFGSQILFKKQMSKLTMQYSLEMKLQKYKSATNLKYILIEAPAFIGIFIYMNSGNALPFVISICLFAYLVSQRPTKQHIIQNLPLSKGEIERL